MVLRGALSRLVVCPGHVPTHGRVNLSGGCRAVRLLPGWPAHNGRDIRAHRSHPGVRFRRARQQSRRWRRSSRARPGTRPCWLLSMTSTGSMATSRPGGRQGLRRPAHRHLRRARSRVCHIVVGRRRHCVRARRHLNPPGQLARPSQLQCHGSAAVGANSAARPASRPHIHLEDDCPAFHEHKPAIHGRPMCRRNDLPAILGTELRQPQFLPFIRYNIQFGASR